MFRPLLDDLYAREKSEKKAGREECGDSFLRSSSVVGARRRQGRFHLCLASEAMRDHAGVDFCQAGHAERLRAEGLLKRASCCDGRRPIPRGEKLEILCIDDYISLKKAT